MGACITLHKYDNKYNEFNQTNFLAAHFAKRNTKFGGGGKKLESESEGGQKFLPPNPLPFCPPERLDFKIRNSDFRQKMFELRPKNTAKLNEKQKTPKGAFCVDPAGLAPASLGANASMLLYTTRARIHNLILNKKNSLFKSSFC